MRKLRKDTFSGNKDEDAHDHIDRVLSIAGLFNILGFSKDAVMLRVFPFTLTGFVKRWVDRLAPGTINTWDLFKKAFIQRYCPPFMTVKQLEDIHNFKQEGDKSLYQAWERYNDLLYKCPTHDINSHQKIFLDYRVTLGTVAGVDVDTLTMEQYLALSRENQAPGVVKPEIGGNVNFEIKSQFMHELRKDTFFGNKDEDAHVHIDRVLCIIGLFNIPESLKSSHALSFSLYSYRIHKKLEDIHNFKQEGDESLYQAWERTTSRNIGSSSSKDELVALVNKLDNLGKDMKKLKESVQAIQVGCQICKGPHLDKDCPLNEEVKHVEWSDMENLDEQRLLIEILGENFM
ncbi:putative reverse transcriptase domain-containing protein [Tanacetum coccineum]